MSERGKRGDAGTKAGPHWPEMAKEQSGCQGLLLGSRGSALGTRRVLGRDREQPGATANQAALPSAHAGAPGAGGRDAN